MSAGKRITERTTKIDGTIREYQLTLLLERPGLVVARYVIEHQVGPPRLPVRIPAGSTSDGYFWTGRDYSIYRMKATTGALIGHRFDAVRDVTIGPGLVSYRDTVLDWWILPDGAVLEEDYDELQEAVAAGLVTAAEAEAIVVEGRAAQAAWPDIRAEIEGIEAAFR